MDHRFRFPGFRHKALTFSYDDGVRADQRLVAILREQGLRGTFNVNTGLFGTAPGQNRLTAEEVKELYLPQGMELAMHGYTHAHMEALPSETALYEIVADRQHLEALCGRVTRGFAYPYGTYSDRLVEQLRQAGVIYARTVASTGRFTMPEDWLRWHPTCHHNDPRLMDLAEQFLALQEDTQYAMRTGLSLFYLWGHSYEFDNCQNWHVIEQFAARVAGREDIWYATNGEIWEYMHAVQQLDVSLDGRICHNPTHLPVYFLANGCRRYTVPAGETICITE